MTPLESYPDLATTLGIKSLYFKREDLHKYGSHKGRSIPFMIDYYHGKGDKKFAISSSGNAALAAALYIKDLNSNIKDLISLDIYIGRNINPHKLEKIKSLADDNIRVLIKERPLQALSQAIEDGYRSLRQSTDDVALIGYESLAKELAEVKDLGAVFIGTSSGTTAQALADYFLKKNIKCQVHIVQTSFCHPMSDALSSYDGPEEISIAEAIVDKTALRKSALIPLIEKTGGTGWVADNEQIGNAQQMVVDKTGLEISTNSALSVVGLTEASYQGFEITGSVVCLICGD